MAITKKATKINEDKHKLVSQIKGMVSRVPLCIIKADAGRSSQWVLAAHRCYRNMAAIEAGGKVALSELTNSVGFLKLIVSEAEQRGQS
jgi:hypothetical protein